MGSFPLSETKSVHHVLLFGSCEGATDPERCSIYFDDICIGYESIPPEPTVMVDVHAIIPETYMDMKYPVNISVTALDSWPGGLTNFVVHENKDIHATWDIHDNEYWDLWAGEWKRRPEANCNLYQYDDVLDKWDVKKEDYQFGHDVISFDLPPGETVRFYVEGYHRWYWIEPWNWDRVIGIVASLLDPLHIVGPSLLGKQAADALSGQQQVVYTYTATCETSEDTDTTTVEVPIEKYILLGQSVGFHIAGSFATLAAKAPGPHSLPLYALEAACIILGEEWYVLASDPPDFNYTEVAIPEIPDVPDLNMIDNPDFREAAEKAIELAATGVALRISLERYEGAKIDGIPQYMALQMEAARFYLSKMMGLTQWLSDFWGPISADLTIPNSQQIQQIRDTLSQDGLPDLEVTILASFGYSAEQMTQIAQSLASCLMNISRLLI